MGPSGGHEARGGRRRSRAKQRLIERANPVIETASQYTELRYGLRLRTVAGFAAALVAIVAWPLVRRLRRRRP